MSSKTLFESVMWGTARQVQDILAQRELPQDDNYTDYALLMSALRRKRKEIARILLNKGCRVRREPATGSGDTPLHFAVRMGDWELVHLLLKGGATADSKDQNGETPLHAAMKKGNDEIVDMILYSKGARSVNVVNEDGFSHFHIACIRDNIFIAEYFLQNGVDVNACVKFDSSKWSGYTPLHFAVEYNSIDMIKVLLDYKAKLSAKNAEDKTALHLAMQKQNDIAADIMLSASVGDYSNPADENGITHFHIACMKYHLLAVENYLLHGVPINQAVDSKSSLWPGYTALHFAVKGLSVNFDNQILLIKLLLRYKADVNMTDAHGQTPLHLACLQNDEKIAKLIQEALKTFENTMFPAESENIEELLVILSKIDQVKIIELLLEYKSDVNAKNSLNETPLFYLFKGDRTKILSKAKCEEFTANEVVKELNQKRIQITKLLLELGADVGISNEAGLSLLHLVASINKSYDDPYKEELASLLLNRGADVNSRAKYGSTPLHLAAKEGHSKLINLLVRRDAEINSRETSDQSTPLHLAVAYQQARAIWMLIVWKADVSAAKSDGMTVLHLMALINPDGSAEPEFIKHYEHLVNAFIERGCDIDAQDVNGRSALHLAAWEHNNAATWALLSCFADVNVEDCAGETPMSFPINSTQRSRDIYCMFRSYVNMLKLAGLPISDKTQACFDQLYDGDETREDDFLDQCREELGQMKTVRVGGSGCLYDLLRASTDRMAVHAGNEELKEYLASDKFKEDFKLYGNLLKAQIRKGLARKALVRDAKESLEAMIGMGLPDDCAEKIFQYLNDKDLRNVVKAKTAVACKSKKSYGSWKPYDPNECTSLEKAIAYCKRLFDKQAEMEIV